MLYAQKHYLVGVSWVNTCKADGVVLGPEWILLGLTIITSFNHTATL